MRSRFPLASLLAAVVSLLAGLSAAADPCCLNLSCEDRDPADCAAHGGIAGYCRTGEACGAPACDPAGIQQIDGVAAAVVIRSGGLDIRLTWQADPNADGYDVRYVTDPALIPQLRAGISPPAIDVPGCAPAMIPEAVHVEPVTGTAGEIFYYGVLGVCTSAAQGACCSPDGRTCDILTRGGCGAQGGLFVESSTSCDACAGACCFADGSPCMEATRDTCEGAAGGVFNGALSTCAGTDCTFGACCMPWGCMEGTAAACALEGGTYGGDGIACSTHPCGPTGGCCHSSGCLDWLFEDGCLDGTWGTWLGFDVPCAGVDCTQHQGACCDWPFPGECVDDTWEGQCIGSGGTWQGGGIDCSSNPC